MALPPRLYPQALASGAVLCALLAGAAVAQSHTQVEKACVAEFVGVRPALPACDFALDGDGMLSYRQKALARPLAVSYVQGPGGAAPVGARQVILFPPAPGGQYRVLQACDGTTASALCWSVFVFDARAGRVRQAYGGKYGPDRWQSWSPDGQRVVLASQGGGASWLHVIDPASGKTRSFPGDKARENWRIQPETLKWTGTRSFTVMVQTCATCDARRRNIRF
ncbi:TolB family protein [Bordetella flabilis]|uniref:Dipeptidylpeptidase IV N-terminal domain-containing protein n=1 Tax=Bordetella flabilis TaxID=463014 RepID=A0A193G8Y8_9BORD|nr:hypothetical protein [Bordetella flabilis]ANN76452.1 hypothetical protein BAU07_04375 [Bordetella flabilis]